MTERLYTIPVTRCLDSQTHHVTDDNMTTGRETGYYQALCGHTVVAAPMTAPLGRRCATCTAVVTSHPPTTTPVHRPRHRRRGQLWRILHPHRRATVNVGAHMTGSQHNEGAQ